MLSSLINFSARQDASVLQNMDRQPVKAMKFYREMLDNNYYWNSKFNDRSGSESSVEDPEDENCVEEGQSKGDSESNKNCLEEGQGERSYPEDEENCVEGRSEGDSEDEGNHVDKGQSKGDLDDEESYVEESQSEGDSENEEINVEVVGQSEGETEHDSNNEPDLEIAGARFPVYSHQVEAHMDPDDVEMYLARVDAPYGYHMDDTYTDTVFN